MNENALQINEQLAKLDKEFPLIPYTGSSRLFSMVRRMKAEKESGIPISRRSGFAISVKTGKRASEMTKREWEDFYKDLSEELKKDFPELYHRVFPEKQYSNPLPQKFYVPLSLSAEEALRLVKAFFGIGKKKF